MMRTDSMGSGGFTLIETLVATMILAISLAVILQLFSMGLKTNRLTAGYSRASFYAMEKMEEILLSRTLAQGEETSGAFADGYTWLARVEALAPQVAEHERKPPVDLFKIKVNVSWKEGYRTKHLDLETLHMITVKR